MNEIAFIIRTKIENQKNSLNFCLNSDMKFYFYTSFFLQIFKSFNEVKQNKEVTAYKI